MKRSLELTTMIGCPLMCTICPQDKLKAAYEGDKYMSLDTLQKALTTVPDDVKILFCGYSEPWANPDATDMLEYVLSSGYTINVFTTLYGMTDSARVVELLRKFKSQVDSIWLHLPDNNNMPGYKSSNEYNEALTNMLTLSPNIMTMDDNDRLHDSIKSFNLKATHWPFITRAENIQPHDSIKVTLAESTNNEYIVECFRNKDMTENILLPNGDVTLCCMDYGNKHVIGNLLHQTYDEVLKGIEPIKTANATLFDKSTLCRKCQDTYHRTPWNDEEVYEMVKQIDPDSLGL